MTRRTLLSAFVALFAMTLVTFIAGTGSARAQQSPNCCVYYMDVQVSANCFPIQYWIKWNNIPVGPGVINTNSNPPFPFVFAIPGMCPPAATFGGISLAGAAGPYATYNNPVTFNVNGCCLVARIGYDANGCIYIYIRQQASC